MIGMMQARNLLYFSGLKTSFLDTTSVYVSYVLCKVYFDFYVHFKICLQRCGQCNIRFSLTYEGHSEVIDTPLAFWTLGETKTTAYSKVKRED